MHGPISSSSRTGFFGFALVRAVPTASETEWRKNILLFLHLSPWSQAGLPPPLSNTPPSSGKLMDIFWSCNLPVQSRGQGCFGMACLEAEISSGTSLWDAGNPRMG